jgi:hypothetical protein
MSYFPIFFLSVASTIFAWATGYKTSGNNDEGLRGSTQAERETLPELRPASMKTVA